MAIVYFLITLIIGVLFGVAAVNFIIKTAIKKPTAFNIVFSGIMSAISVLMILESFFTYFKEIL